MRKQKAKKSRLNLTGLDKTRKRIFFFLQGKRNERFPIVRQAKVEKRNAKADAILACINEQDFGCYKSKILKLIAVITGYSFPSVEAGADSFKAWELRYVPHIVNSQVFVGIVDGVLKGDGEAGGLTKLKSAVSACSDSALKEFCAGLTDKTIRKYFPLA